jgi:uncharacterized protein (TIGR03437 family)
LVYAYATGPVPRMTTAPGDDSLGCSTAGCHTGTALNGGGGSVAVNFPGGMSYSPGVPQTFSVVVTDARARVYGFQMTARLESNLANGQAGDFTAGPGQIVICENESNKAPGKPCPANGPVQFIEHGPLSPFNTDTISVQWTPPDTNAGNIHIHVAANAANGDANSTGDHIYSAHYVLAPQSSSPSIAALVSASAFNPQGGLASGTWLEMYGSNLSTTSRSWTGDDFKGSRAPTSLDGLTVTVNGIPVFIDFVSPGQVNFQAPEDAVTGSAIEVQLSNSAGRSNTFTLPKTAIAPALLAPPSFNVNGREFVVAQFPDLTYVGKPGLLAGLNFRPARVGDSITIYAIGCGPVNPPTPAGTVASGLTALQNTPIFRVGGVPATLTYAGLTPDVGGCISSI